MDYIIVKQLYISFHFENLKDFISKHILFWCFEGIYGYVVIILFNWNGFNRSLNVDE